MSYENFNKKNMKTGAMKRFGLMMVCVWLTCLGATAQTYRGFVDAAMTFDIPKGFDYFSGEPGLPYYTDVCPVLAFSTTHGVQINRNHYLGIGMEFNKYFSGIYSGEDNEKIGSLPIYAMWRMDFFGRKVTPFFDVRAGYQVAWTKGFYGNINAGMRISLSRRTGLNISIGARMSRYSDSMTWIHMYETSYTNSDYQAKVFYNVFGFMLRAGVDF
jgi:hypothetical protein